MISLEIYRSLEQYAKLFREYLSKNCSAEDQIRDKLTPATNSLIASGELRMDFGVNKNIVKHLTAKQKAAFIDMLDLLEYYFLEELPEIFGTWKYFILESILPEMKGHSTYSVLFDLSLKNRIVVLEKKLQIPRNQRIFWQQWSKRKTFNKNTASLLERLFDNDFQLKIFIYTPRKARKSVFRKGYRDHGSLGTDLSKIIREERIDVFLKEQEKNRRITQILHFLEIHDLILDDLQG